MCNLFWQIGQRGHFYLLFNPINTNLVEDNNPTLRSCFLSSFAKFHSAVSEEKSKYVSANQRPWPPYCFFLIGPKNTNLVEDVEHLVSVQFRWIAFSSFWEVKNVSANQRPVWPSCFSDRPDKHKLCSGHWYLASCQVWLNSVQRFQRRSRKCLSQSEARTAIMFFRSIRKTQTW